MCLITSLIPQARVTQMAEDLPASASRQAGLASAAAGSASPAPTSTFTPSTAALAADPEGAARLLFLAGASRPGPCLHSSLATLIPFTPCCRSPLPLPCAQPSVPNTHGSAYAAPCTTSHASPPTGLFHPPCALRAGAPSSSEAPWWFYVDDQGKVQGPFDADKLIK